MNIPWRKMARLRLHIPALIIWDWGFKITTALEDGREIPVLMLIPFWLHPEAVFRH